MGSQRCGYGRGNASGSALEMERECAHPLHAGITHIYAQALVDALSAKLIKISSGASHSTGTLT